MAYMYKKNGNWRVTICRHGKRKDIDLGNDLNRAKIIKASMEQACQDERFKQNLVDTLIELGLLEKGSPVTPGGNLITWDFAKQKLLEHLKNLGRAPKTIRLYEYIFLSIEKTIKPTKPADVTNEKADKWITTLLITPKANDKTGKTKFSPVTVNIYARMAKAAFTRFVRWEFIEKNPFFNCEVPKGEVTLPRPLADDELEKLLKASNKPLQRCVKILVRSGMRPDEFYHLPWRRVILGSNPYIHIIKDGDWTPKAHTERRIPATTELIKALGKPGLPEERVAGKNEAYFPVGPNWLARSFSRAVKRAGLAGRKITVYCCRDTYATNLALQGYEAHAIAARLGHGNLETSMRYVSLARLNSDKIGK